MHRLKYVSLNRKDWLKNMLGTTLGVAMPANLTLIGLQNVNGAALES